MNGSENDPTRDTEQRLRRWFMDVEEPPPATLATSVEARTDRLSQRRHLAWWPWWSVSRRRMFLATATAAAVALAALIPLSGIGRLPDPPSEPELCSIGSTEAPEAVLDGVWSRGGSTALLQQVGDEVWVLDIAEGGDGQSMTLIRGTRSRASIEGALLQLYSTDELGEGPVVSRVRGSESASGSEEPGVRLEIVTGPDGLSPGAWRPVCPATERAAAAADVSLPAVVDDRPRPRDPAARCVRRDQPTGAFWPMWRSDAHEVVYLRQIESTWWLVAWSAVSSNARPSVLVLAAEGQTDRLPARWVDLVAGTSGSAELSITAAGLRVEDGTGQSGLGTLEACEFP